MDVLAFFAPPAPNAATTGEGAPPSTARAGEASPFAALLGASKGRDASADGDAPMDDGAWTGDDEPAALAAPADAVADVALEFVQEIQAEPALDGIPGGAADAAGSAPALEPTRPLGWGWTSEAGSAGATPSASAGAPGAQVPARSGAASGSAPLSGLSAADLGSGAAGGGAAGMDAFAAASVGDPRAPAAAMDGLPLSEDAAGAEPALDARTAQAMEARAARLAAMAGSSAAKASAAEPLSSRALQEAASWKEAAAPSRRDGARSVMAEAMASDDPGFEAPPAAPVNAAGPAAPKPTAAPPLAASTHLFDTSAAGAATSVDADAADAGMDLMEADGLRDLSRESLRANAGEARPRPPVMDAAGAAALASRMARRAADGSTRFQLRLDPPELGRVDVRLQIDADGVARAHLTVERPEALQELSRHVRAFERAFHEAGVTLEREGLAFDLAPEGDREGAFADDFEDDPSRAQTADDGGAAPDTDARGDAGDGRAALTSVTAFEDAHGFTIMRHTPLDLSV